MTGGSNKLIFIGGVHGSGKTTIGGMAAARIGASLLSCSQIIRTERQTLDVSTAGVDEIEVNQRALIAGLKRLRISISVIILDGHFTLKTQTDGIQPIPIQVFDAMLPDALFLVEASPSSICSRLSKRDGIVISEVEITQHQEQERRFAEVVSRHLGCRLIVLNGNGDDAHLAVVSAVQ